MIDINPYASPVVIDEAAPVTPTTAHRPYTERFLWALGRWTIICGVSAAPSFWIWYDGHREAVHVIGMLCGIAVFIVGYAFLECSRWYEKARQIPNARTALYTGYISRMVLSLLFPVTFLVDMCFGMVAVGIVEACGGVRMTPWPSPDENLFLTCLSVFATTVVEGILLNFALVGYMGVVFGLLCAIRPGVRPRNLPPEATFASSRD